MTVCSHCEGKGRWASADRWVVLGIGGEDYWEDIWYSCAHCAGTGEAQEGEADCAVDSSSTSLPE